ncbi:MAG TPA: pilus assembly protein TadG-related protein [Terriglobales bacterium]|nr:pilus assembly protein TadG-related protein [Terriglobales bacterium]
MLFVIGAMAALSIDEVTLYTARSEAQLAADAAALAGARVLANSGTNLRYERRIDAKRADHRPNSRHSGRGAKPNWGKEPDRR